MKLVNCFPNAICALSFTRMCGAFNMIGIGKIKCFYMVADWKTSFISSNIKAGHMRSFKLCGQQSSLQTLLFGIVPEGTKYNDCFNTRFLYAFRYCLVYCFYNFIWPQAFLQML